MLRFISEATPLPRGIFQGNPNGGAFCRREDFIQACRDPFKSDLLARPQMRAGVHHEKGNTELGCQPDFLDEGLDGFIPVKGWWCTKINQVTGVAEDASKVVCGKLIG